MHTMQRCGHVYLARSAVVVGDVELGEDSNVWHHCAIRGDVAPIRVGKRVNIQDGVVLHCDQDVPLTIADDVAIGHHAVIHCRSVGARTLIGMRSTILDRCEIGADCLIAAGALVPPRTKVPDGSVLMGVPAEVVRGIRDEEREYIRKVVAGYIDLARRSAAGEFKAYGDQEWPTDG